MSNNVPSDSVFRSLRVILRAVVICSACVFSSFYVRLNAQQTPDWMFALEGSYVGRFEMDLDDSDDVLTLDARLDGLRNGKEDGFVLQVSTEREGQIEKSAQMWSWNDDAAMVEITSLSERQASTSTWFVSSSGLMTTLTRGSSDSEAAVIERWRLERLPGQLRWDKSVNKGDGEWQFRWRYVLDELEN